MNKIHSDKVEYVTIIIDLSLSTLGEQSFPYFSFDNNFIRNNYD